jgi:hypothetical protein
LKRRALEMKKLKHWNMIYCQNTYCSILNKFQSKN